MRGKSTRKTGDMQANLALLPCLLARSSNNASVKTGTKAVLVCARCERSTKKMPLKAECECSRQKENDYQV